MLLEKLNVNGISRDVGKLQQCFIELEVSKIYLPCLPHFTCEIELVSFILRIQHELIGLFIIEEMTIMHRNVYFNILLSITNNHKLSRKTLHVKSR